METVSNVVNSASNAIWGKQSNTAQVDAKTANNETAGQEPLSGATGAGTAEEPFDKGNALPDRTAARNETGGVEPLSGVQGAGRVDEPFDKGNSVPSTGGALGGERGDLIQEGERPISSNDRSDGPTKLEEVVSIESPNEDRSAIVAQEGGTDFGKETGTGEQWVKTSGVAAEGGDFDATKPGAAKEAARLREETDETTSAKPAASEETSTEKPSKMERLKEKLHIGSGKHN